MKRIFLLVVLLVLVAVFWLIWSQDEYQCTQYDNRDDCVLKFIRDNQVTEVNICNEIADAEKKDRCYFDIAFREEDIGTCQYIQEQSTKETCVRTANLTI